MWRLKIAKAISYSLNNFKRIKFEDFIRSYKQGRI